MAQTSQEQGAELREGRQKCQVCRHASQRPSQGLGQCIRGGNVVQLCIALPTLEGGFSGSLLRYSRKPYPLGLCGISPPTPQPSSSPGTLSSDAALIASIGKGFFSVRKPPGALLSLCQRSSCWDPPSQSCFFLLGPQPPPPASEPLPRKISRHRHTFPMQSLFTRDASRTERRATTSGTLSCIPPRPHT